MRLPILFCLIFYSFSLSAQSSTTFIKVHFLYGSKPKKAFKNTENKWFGGILGGHVGIEIDSNEILNFLPSGKFHYITKRKNKHSSFHTHSFNAFYEILGGEAADNKKVIISIPITEKQFTELETIKESYLGETPYDYAFIGMRCGASTYEILSQLGILKSYSNAKTYRKIFYPRKLRKRLFKLAAENNWNIEQFEGSEFRKWERDF